MSSPSAYQCLFCNHLNPAGASFCNECGSQLQLQQCDLCGSINKRSARVCYKCGAAFTFASPLGANIAMLDHCAPTVAALDHAAIEHAQTTLPESVVEALGARRAEREDAAVRGGLRKSCVDGAPVVDAAETVDEHALAVSASGPALPSAGAAPTASGFNYRHALALVALVSLLALASIIFIRGASGPGAPVEQVGSTQAGGDTAPSSASGAVEVVSRSALPAPLADDVSTPAVAPSGVAKSEGSEADGKPAVPREPVGTACQPAVAALGLCEAVPTQEKR